MLRLCLLLTVAASSAALSAPPAGLRPSVAGFRTAATRKTDLELRGGGADCDFKIDTTTALKTSSVTMAIFAALSIPNSPLPLIDFTGKTHPNQVSLFFGAPAPNAGGKGKPAAAANTQTLAVEKTMMWVAWGYAWVVGLTWTAAESKDAAFKKTACKVGAAMAVAGLGVLTLNNQPLACGGHITCAVMAVINTLGALA